MSANVTRSRFTVGASSLTHRVRIVEFWIAKVPAVIKLACNPIKSTFVKVMLVSAVAENCRTKSTTTSSKVKSTSVLVIVVSKIDANLTIPVGVDLMISGGEETCEL